MASLWFLPVMGLLLIGMGCWQSFASLDTLWQRQENYLLRRGEAPQRSDLWEQNTRRGGGVIIVLGVIMLILGLITIGSIPQKMSGVSIDGHELTQQQWDDCHHDGAVCMSEYMNGQMDGRTH